jgi:hypothetical protein
MDAPSDGDELAGVVPLRRRDRELTATPAARGSLPRERAPFDPEIEPGDTPSTPILPRRIAPHLTRSAVRWPRVPGSQDDRPAATSRRYSRAVLMTGAAGAAVATVAPLTLLVLNPSPRSLATQLESLGGRVTAGALEPTKPGVLSLIANPLGTNDQAAVPNTKRTVALRSHRARPKPREARSTPTRSTGRMTTKSNHSAVIASHQRTSSTSSGRRESRCGGSWWRSMWS